MQSDLKEIKLKLKLKNLKIDFQLNSVKPNKEDSDLLTEDQNNETNVNNLQIDQSETVDLGDKKVNNKQSKKINPLDLIKIDSIHHDCFKEVKLMYHKLKKKFFACKIFKITMIDKRESFVEEELKMHHSLKCPYIIRSYTSFYCNSELHIVLEYMNKGDLCNILRKVKKIPEEILGLISLQVLKGLKFLHDKYKIVHIIPSKILLNSNGCTKISLGHRFLNTVNCNFAYNPSIEDYGYMSPEMIELKAYTFNSDIWSLGLILLECAMGYFPYIMYIDFNDLLRSMEDIIIKNESPKLPIENFSEEFCDFIDLCLCKDKNKRSSASTLLKHPFILLYENQDICILANWLNQIE